MRDNDGKFQGGFDERMKSLGMDVKRVSPMSPNLNAYIERWIQTVKTECLAHFIVLGEKHLQHIVGEFVDFYNNFRPHQNKGNRPLDVYRPPDDGPPPTLDEIECHSRLGGLLNHYTRKAA